MMYRLILAAVLIAVAGCAHREPRPPGCDGSARRPANPHGSVLAPDAAPPPPVAARSEAGGGCA